MRLLVRYLSVLLDDGRVSAVHLWDMTMDQADRIWLRHLSQLDGRYEVKGCKWDPEKPLWRYSCPYRYYAQAESFRDDDLLLKIDDDIVFMDLQRFGHFIDAVKEGHIYFPNVRSRMTHPCLVTLLAVSSSSSCC